MKKFFSFILSSLITISLWAYDFKSGNLCYNITSDMTPYTVEVTYEEDGSSNYQGLVTVTIPASVEYEGIIYTVTSIGNAAFKGCSSLDTVFVEAAIPPTIGDEVFTSSPTCYIPCGTLAAYEASDWAEQVGEFVEQCEIDTEYVLLYTSYDGNIVEPTNREAFGANIVSNTYENGIGKITFDGCILKYF